MQMEIEVPQLRGLIVARLEQLYSPADAELMADAVLFGDLIARPSHGIARLLPGSYGAMDEEPGPPPVIEQLAPAIARIHGRPGMLVASMATDLVAQLATEHGLALVTTNGSRSTSGSLTYYLEQLTNAGLVAMVTANTLSLITPPGGAERVLGTNPIALGMPAVGYPFIADLATSAITGGEVIASAGTGTPIRDGAGVDSTGAVTTDAGAVLAGGALLPFGGHKGLGLSVMIELLNGVLAGATAAPAGPTDDWGHVFLAISTAVFGATEELRQEAQRIIDRIAAVDTRDRPPVRIPGHRSLETRDAALEHGTVMLDAGVYQQLVELVGS